MKTRHRTTYPIGTILGKDKNGADICVGHTIRTADGNRYYVNPYGGLSCYNDKGEWRSTAPFGGWDLNTVERVTLLGELVFPRAAIYVAQIKQLNAPVTSESKPAPAEPQLEFKEPIDPAENYPKAMEFLAKTIEVTNDLYHKVEEMRTSLDSLMEVI